MHSDIVLGERNVKLYFANDCRIYGGIDDDDDDWLFNSDVPLKIRDRSCSQRTSNGDGWSPIKNNEELVFSTKFLVVIMFL